MQLEQQETFVIHGPQLEVLGTAESKLPAPLKKRGTAAAVLAALALVSVFGIGGARLKGLHDKTAALYTAAQDKYGHSIQGDFAAQADAAANLIRVAGRTLGQAALDAWNAQGDADPAQQYALNRTLAGAVDLAYTAAADTAAAQEKGQLDDLHASFTSAQATVERAAAAYNEQAQAYNQTAGGFPAVVLAGLWGAQPLAYFAP